jgi:hypothetical protein
VEERASTTFKGQAASKWHDGKAPITTWTVHHILASSKSVVVRRCDCLLSNFTFCNIWWCAAHLPSSYWIYSNSFLMPTDAAKF